MKRVGFFLLMLALTVSLSSCRLAPGTTPPPANEPTNPTDAADPTAPPDPSDPVTPAAASFGVSSSASGPFSNDAENPIKRDDDPRIIRVAAGSTFYAQVNFKDPEGIKDVRLSLVNKRPEGIAASIGTETPDAGFTRGEPTGCTLDGSATTISCVYPIMVEAGTPDISALPGAGDEFAYVFRASVIDNANNVNAVPIRGYINIE